MTAFGGWASMHMELTRRHFKENDLCDHTAVRVNFAVKMYVIRGLVVGATGVLSGARSPAGTTLATSSEQAPRLPTALV